MSVQALAVLVSSAVVAVLSAAAAAGGAGGAAGIDADSLAQRMKLRYDRVPRKVLAFYYPWYGQAASPGGSGQNAHWGRIDAANKDIQESTHYPALGAYDSHDPKVIAQHCRWCKAAGVDALVVSWWGKGHFTDQAMTRILDGCAAGGLEATIYYESVPPPTDGEAAAKDILAALERYAGHKAWLKVAGRPVVFVYGRAVGQIGLTGWLDATVRLNRAYKGPGVPGLIGDQFSPQAARIFDGVHTYNPCGELRGKTPDEVRAWAKQRYPAWVHLADAVGRISTITVIPGYDDTKIRKPGLAVRRFDGKLYQAQWEQAIAADPHWVIVTSFNEWHEGSEIEPSAQDGQKYLDMTAKYAAKFKALGERPAAKASAAAASKISAEQKAALARKLNALKVAALPGADSPMVWWLIEIGVRPTMLSWEQVVSGPLTRERFGILLYASGEHYRQTVKTSGDVDAAILGYLRSGGLLLACPSLPMPFHYNEKDEAVASAGKFGLPLSVAGEHGGWETPPAGVTLRLVNPYKAAKASVDLMPGVPESTPFPSEGDLRWRPFVPGLLPKGTRFVPLIALKDAQGLSAKEYGYAAAAATYVGPGPLEGGRVVYAWFGLLADPTLAEPVMYDLLRLAAEQ